MFLEVRCCARHKLSGLAGMAEYGAIAGLTDSHESVEAGPRRTTNPKLASASSAARDGGAFQQSVVHGTFQDSGLAGAAHSHAAGAAVRGTSTGISKQQWVRTGVLATGCAAVFLCIGAVAGGLDGLTSSSSPVGASMNLHGATAQRTGISLRVCAGTWLILCFSGVLAVN